MERGPQLSPAPAGHPAGAELLHELLRRTHLSAPSDIAAIVADQARVIGARDVDLYLADIEQESLVPLAGSDGGDALETLSIGGTLAGRVFSSSTILTAPGAEPGLRRLWLPLLDGTERIGVLGLTFAEGAIADPLVVTCERYAHLVAMLVVTKRAYGDAIERTRRRQPMTIASELLWSLVPPMVFATDRLVVAGMLEPGYDNGGDALDYAVNGRMLHLGVFDAMGHGLAAAGVAAFAIAAYRHSRRVGLGLLETYAAMDEAVGRQFPENRFVTAVIATLDLDRGHLTWVSAGHPPPLLIRNGRRARVLDAQPAPPLGIGFAHAAPVVAAESLEPGDLLLLYTDGVTEARDPSGRLFTVEGLSGFIEREASAGQTTPETLRRLRQALAGSPRAELRDDATALLIEWRRGGELDLMPPTVL
jgi:hypothetical protein